MKRKMQRTLSLFLTAALLLSGCGAEKSSSASVNQSAADYGWTDDAKMEETAVMESEVDSEMMDTAASGASGITPQEAANADIASRKLIKTVSLSMETKEFDKMKADLERSIQSFGGYIENSSFDAPQGAYGSYYRYYSLTVRVPSESLDAFVASAGELGTLTNKSENVEDVTLDYVDKKAYKESLQVEYDRVMELLEKAEDLDQILALESKLSQLRYEINSYESQLRTYDNLIDYSTVHIYISEVEYEKVVSDTIGSRISNGFRSSLYAVRDFFVDLFVGLVSNLPVLVLLAAGAVVVIALIRKIMKKAAKKRIQRLDSKEEKSEKKSE